MRCVRSQKSRESQNEDLYIVMPAYNEELNISAVIQEWYKIIDCMSDRSRLIVADSGSIDGTHDILVQMIDEYPKLKIMSSTKKEHGPKCITLYKYAIDNNVNWVFQTDSDGQTVPSEFWKFWNDRDNYDAIFGNRVYRGDGAGRKLVEKVLVMLLYLFFRVKVPDANAPFRLLRTDVLKKYIDDVPEDYFLPNAILTAMFVKNRNKVNFKEITFRKRRDGENSIDHFKIFCIGLKSLKDFIFFKKII